MYNKLELDNYQLAIYHSHYNEKSGVIESAYDPFSFWPLFKLLLLLSSLSDCYNRRTFLAALILTYNSCTWTAEPGIINEVDFKFIIK